MRLILYVFINSLSHFFCEKMTAPSEMERKHELNLIYHTVGQGLAPAVRLLLIYDGLRLLSNENASRIMPSSDEEGGTPQA